LCEHYESPQENPSMKISQNGILSTNETLRR
jgi:hypothetical protein